MRKRVLIVGLGSFGSQVAVDLAKSAVGSFSLVDFDKVERHNVVRHACSLGDVGRLKTDAVKDLILGKNPFAAYMSPDDAEAVAGDSQMVRRKDFKGYRVSGLRQSGGHDPG